jgi:hypothetical protein
MKLTKSQLRNLVKEELCIVTEEQEGDRHSQGEKLFDSVEKDLPGASSKLSQWSLQHEYSERAKEMGLDHDAVSDAMGLAGYGKVHSES